MTSSPYKPQEVPRFLDDSLSKNIQYIACSFALHPRASAARAAIHFCRLHPRTPRDFIPRIFVHCRRPGDCFQYMVGCVAVFRFFGAVSWFSRVAFTQLMHEAHGMRARQQNRLTDAETHLRKSLAAADRLGPRDPSRARVLEHLTAVARAQGKYDDAESFGRSWIDAEEKISGPDHSRTARAMEALAEVYDGIARHRHAQPLLEKALEIRQRRTDELAEYAACLNALGELVPARAVRKSRSLFRDALPSCAASRPASPDGLVAACNLARRASMFTKWMKRKPWRCPGASREESLAEFDARGVLPGVASRMRAASGMLRGRGGLLRRSMAIVTRCARRIALRCRVCICLSHLASPSRWAEAEMLARPCGSDNTGSRGLGDRATSGGLCRAVGIDESHRRGTRDGASCEIHSRLPFTVSHRLKSWDSIPILSFE